MSKSIPADPTDAVLVRRVRRADGSSASWTVRGGPQTWTVREGGGDEHETDGSLRDVITATPGLRDLEAGTVSDYEVAEETLSPAELAMLVTVVDGAAEDASAWPESETERWSDEDIDELLEDLEWRHRWVEINGVRASAVVVPGREALQLVLLEDDDHLDMVAPLAEFDWSSEGGGRPMSTDGGNSLGWLAPGLLYQRRWGDFGPEHHLVPVADEGASVARAVADWARGPRSSSRSRSRRNPWIPPVLSPRSSARPSRGSSTCARST